MNEANTVIINVICSAVDIDALAPQLIPSMPVAPVSALGASGSRY